MNNNKKQRSIIFSFILMTSVVFVLLFAGWHLARSGFKDIVPIENVEIESSFENISLNDIRSQVTDVLEGGYFTVDLVAVREALLQMPWVEDAAIRRQWPSGLHIRVVEKQAVAYWGEKQLLSSRGELFQPKTIETGWPLPLLNGPEGLHNKVWSFLTEINRQLTDEAYHVSRLQLDERRAWSFALSGEALEKSVIVRLGREDALHRLDRFVQVFSGNPAIDMNVVAVIDMRYPNGFALKKNNRETDALAPEVSGLVREV